MDYTIIGGEVNLASRLQSHAEPGGILLSHETYSLVKDAVTAEEQAPIEVKGLAKPVRNYSVLDHLDRSADQPTLIRSEQEGLRSIWIFRSWTGRQPPKPLRASWPNFAPECRTHAGRCFRATSAATRSMVRRSHRCAGS